VFCFFVHFVNINLAKQTAARTLCYCWYWTDIFAC